MEIKKYDITLDIDFDGLSYKGKEKIEVEGREERFYLNSVGLNISRVASGKNNINFTVNEKEQTLETDLNLNGSTTVEVEFSGEIPDILHGLYNAKYPGGHMLTTQFESTGARRAFPCVDHPGYKSVFTLKLLIDGDLEAISNMPVSSEEKQDSGKKLVVFQDTPVMSTYLLYMGVGKFDNIERQMGSIRGILSAPKGLLNTTDFPLVEADNIIKYFEDYYDIKYPHPKLHLVAVPEFSAGAMENWGAITFREVLLTVNENTSNSVKQVISEVVAHEIAHQWFGDLVTMEWWNDLWLNESFATFMAYKVVDHLHPDWKMFGRMLLTDTSGALTGDALQNTHPIQVEVKSPDDIAQIFDEISYGKGASILRMIEGYVGENNFRDGIRKYLKDHMYGNAKGSDLWSSIEEVSGMPVSRVMETWIMKEGYPVLKTSLSGNKVNISQERFRFNPSGDSSLWPVPLTVKRKGRTQSLLMEGKELEIDATDFIKINADESGFYRVLYDKELMKTIENNPNEISYLDSWGIVCDLYSFLKSGHIGLNEYLEKLSPFLNENEYVVSQEIAAQFMSLNIILDRNEKLRKTAIGYYRRQIDRLGEKKPTEDENDSILRGAISLNLSLIDKEFASTLSKDFPNFFSTDPDVRQAVGVAYAVVNNNFEDISNLLDKAKSDEDRLRILNSLSALMGSENYRKLLELTDSDKVKVQDTMSVYVASSMNPDQRARLFESLEGIVGKMERYFEGTGYTGMVLERIVPYIGLGREKEMERKLHSMRKEGYSKGIDKGLELLSINSRILSNNA